MQERLLSAKVEIEDISETLGDKLEQLGFDARSADKLEARLDVVRSVLRKYGGSFEAMQKFLEDANAEFDMLSNADDTVAKLEKELAKATENLVIKAEKLSKLRRRQLLILYIWFREHRVF